MEDSQKLDYILANMVTKEEAAEMAAKAEAAIKAIEDEQAIMKSDMLTEIDREQRISGQHFDCIEAQLDSLQSTADIMELIYKNVNLLRKSAIDLQGAMEIIGIRIS